MGALSSLHSYQCICALTLLSEHNVIYWGKLPFCIFINNWIFTIRSFLIISFPWHVVVKILSASFYYIKNILAFF